MSQKISLNPPHGGELCELILSPEEVTKLKAESVHFPNHLLTQRQLCDVELLISGGFSPLRGFLTKKDYERVVEELRLVDGTLWPMPVTLDVSEQEASKYKVGDRVALRDVEGSMIAVLTVEEIWVPDRVNEALKVFGSADDTLHPTIDFLLNKSGTHYIGGKLDGIQLPVHYDFADHRLTPRQVRQRFEQLCWSRIVAFQTRNPMHRSHRELTIRAARDAKANLLVHPVVGMTKPGDVDHYTRVRCYKELMKHYPQDLAMLSLLPLAMRMGGPREAVWHALIRKNFGASHFIVGRDHAGPGNNRDGKPFYSEYAAHELVDKYKDELGIQILKYSMVVFVEDRNEYRTQDEIEPGMRVLNISGTELRRRLFRGIEIPEWFTFPSVVKILRQTHPPRDRQGFTVFFTGLSGSGKSTISNALRISLMEEGSRPVTLLDGDEVRSHLSTELGFSKEHRDLNIRRISWVAAQITKARGLAIIAAIAPYRNTRDYARQMIEEFGGFIEVHVSTPLEVCEQRDVKGLYAKARQGVLKNFTGIDDPYEAPIKPEIVIDSSVKSTKEAVHDIILHLESEGYLGVPSTV